MHLHSTQEAVRMRKSLAPVRFIRWLRPSKRSVSVTLPRGASNLSDFSRSFLRILNHGVLFAEATCLLPLFVFNFQPGGRRSGLLLVEGRLHALTRAMAQDVAPKNIRECRAVRE